MNASLQILKTYQVRDKSFFELLEANSQTANNKIQEKQQIGGYDMIYCCTDGVTCIYFHLRIHGKYSVKCPGCIKKEQRHSLSRLLYYYVVQHHEVELILHNLLTTE